MKDTMSAQEHKVFIRANLSHLENMVRNEDWLGASQLAACVSYAAKTVGLQEASDESWTLTSQPDTLDAVLKDIVGIK